MAPGYAYAPKCRMPEESEDIMDRVLLHASNLTLLQNLAFYWFLHAVNNPPGADPGFYTGGGGTSWREVWGPRRSTPIGSRAAPGEGIGGGGELLGIRKYMTSFLNRNWLKLYHVRHDASHRRYVQWSMIFYSWRKALLRLQYEEQQSKAFACSRKTCVSLFNAHYSI